MRNLPKLTIMLSLMVLLLFACNKDNNSLPDAALDNSRGNCGSFAVSVEYVGKVEYEFDIAFQGFTTVHFFNNPSGTIKTRDDLPFAVQNRLVTLQNKPVVKQNPKCPWISPKGVIKIKVFTAQKDEKGIWEQVDDTTAITYTLGDKTPSQTLMGGTRVFCIDKPIGKWYYCSFIQL